MQLRELNDDELARGSGDYGFIFLGVPLVAWLVGGGVAVGTGVAAYYIGKKGANDAYYACLQEQIAKGTSAENAATVCGQGLPQKTPFGIPPWALGIAVGAGAILVLNKYMLKK